MPDRHNFMCFLISPIICIMFTTLQGLLSSDCMNMTLDTLKFEERVKARVADF